MCGAGGRSAIFPEVIGTDSNVSVDEISELLAAHHAPLQAFGRPSCDGGVA